MKEQWVIEAEQYAKDLAKRIYVQITEEAEYMHIDNEWYYEQVVKYMRAEMESD